MTPHPPRSSPRVHALGWLAALVLAALVAFAFFREPALGLLLAVGSCVFAAALRYPDIAVHAVLFLLYSNLPGVGVAFHGVPKLVAAAFPLLLGIPLVRDLCLRRQPLILTPVLYLLVLLLAIQMVGAAFSIDPARSFGSVGTFAVEGVLLYLLVTNVLRTKETLRGATWALLLAGLLMSVVPLFQQATGTFDRNYGGLAQVDGLGFETGEAVEEGGGVKVQVRLAGPIGEKNRYAQVMLVLIPIALLRLVGARSRLARLALLACTASIALGFVLAFSRGGALGMLCVLAVAIGLRLIDLRKAMIAAVGMGLLLVAVPQYWKRLETIAATAEVFDADSGTAGADGATRRRITEMLAAVRVFLDHPVVGVGPAMFKSYAEEYGNRGALRRIEGGRRAHSLYLEIAAENGALGLAVFLAALLLTFVALVSARRANLEADPELAALATTFLLVLIAYCSTGLFLHLAYMRYFYLVLALGGAAAQVGFEGRRVRVAAREKEAFSATGLALSGGGSA